MDCTRTPLFAFLFFSLISAVAGPIEAQDVFPEKIAAPDKNTLTWVTPADVRFVRGALTSVDDYALFSSGTLTMAIALDTGSDVPPPGHGYFYLVKSEIGGSSWQTTLGTEPGRDLQVFPFCSETNPTDAEIDAAGDAALLIYDRPLTDADHWVGVWNSVYDQLGCVFEEHPPVTKTTPEYHCGPQFQVLNPKKSYLAIHVSREPDGMNDACAAHDSCYDANENCPRIPLCAFSTLTSHCVSALETACTNNPYAENYGADKILCKMVQKAIRAPDDPRCAGPQCNGDCRDANSDGIYECVFDLDVHCSGDGTVAPDPPPLFYTPASQCDPSWGATQLTYEEIRDPAPGTPPGTRVELDAGGAANSVFAGWDLDCEPYGTETPCVLVMTEHRFAQARFLPRVELTVGKLGGGDGSVAISPDETCNPERTLCHFPQGSPVHLTAQPDASSEFIRWYVNGLEHVGSDLDLQLTEPSYAVIAVFEQVVPGFHNLTVAKIGSGKALVQASGGGVYEVCRKYDCNGISVLAEANSTVQLSYYIDACATFTGWGGDCSGGNSVFMNAAKNCTAEFTLDTTDDTYVNPTRTSDLVDVRPEPYVTPATNGNYWYSCGQDLTLTTSCNGTTPSNGGRTCTGSHIADFSRWECPEIGISSSDLSVQFTLQGPTGCTAYWDASLTWCYSCLYRDVTQPWIVTGRCSESFDTETECLAAHTEPCPELEGSTSGKTACENLTSSWPPVHECGLSHNQCDDFPP